MNVPSAPERLLSSTDLCINTEVSRLRSKSARGMSSVLEEAEDTVDYSWRKIAKVSTTCTTLTLSHLSMHLA